MGLPHFKSATRTSVTSSHNLKPGHRTDQSRGNGTIGDSLGRPVFDSLEQFRDIKWLDDEIVSADFETLLHIVARLRAVRNTIGTCRKLRIARICRQVSKPSSIGISISRRATVGTTR